MVQLPGTAGVTPTHVLACLCALAASAPGATAAPLEEILVTGSRTEARTALSSPVPIDVFEARDLQRAAGITGELGDALEKLAPSFGFLRQSNSGTSDHIRAPQLRGMSPDQILVLVNGKRRHVSAVVNTETKIGRGTAAVDLNGIPLAAVKRIEILRDGAGALYGSDAIAGVINIILDDAPSGGTVSISGGVHHTHPGALDRTLTDGETVAGALDYGFALGTSGFLRFGGGRTERNATNRAGFDQIPFFVPQTPANLALRGRRNYAMGDPESEETHLWANASHALGALELYGFGTYVQRDTEGATFFRYPDDPRNVPAIFPGGFLPRTTGEDENAALTLGARAALGGWDVDASATYGQDTFVFGARNTVNASLGAASPTAFESGTFVYRQLTTDLGLRRNLPAAPLIGPVTAALGLQFRGESFKTSPGEPASFRAGPVASDIGAQGAPGLTPDDRARQRRDVFSAYAELSAQPLPRLHGSLAGRYERYSDIGAAWSGRFSTLLDVLPQLAGRFSVSNSVRAPALSQKGFSDRTINFGTDRTLVSTRTIPVDDPIAVALGAEPLDAESSVNLNAGLIATPLADLRMTLDLFRIDVDDRITLSERLFGPALAAFVQDLPGGAGTQSVRFFTNAIDTRTEGIEFVMNYRQPLWHGDLETDVAFSYVRTDIEHIAPTPAALRALDADFRLIGVEEINTIEEATPREKLVLSASWSDARWTLTPRLRWYGSTVRVFNFGGGFAPRQRYGDEAALDLDIAYRAHATLSVAVGVNNLTDNYPDRSDPEINFFGNLPYDILSPIGINGRYLYGRLVYHF